MDSPNPSCYIQLDRGVSLPRLTSYILALLLCSSSYASETHWTDSYQLTPTQVQLLLRWEKEQKFDHVKLLSFAESYEKYNLKPKPYVPPHTHQELIEVSEWAAGNAFSFFAKYAGYSFDSEAYKADCPSWILFNFGYSTGTEYFRVDVLLIYLNTFSSLQMMYAHHPETFAQKFLELAQVRGFDQYLVSAESTANIY
jgi:hypothetical protein